MASSPETPESPEAARSVTPCSASFMASVSNAATWGLLSCTGVIIRWGRGGPSKKRRMSNAHLLRRQVVLGRAVADTDDLADKGEKQV